MTNLHEESTQYLKILSLEEALETEVVTWLKNYRSPATRKNYQCYINNFIRTLQLQDVRDFQKVRKLNVIFFVTNWRNAANQTDQ